MTGNYINMTPVAPEASSYTRVLDQKRHPGPTIIKIGWPIPEWAAAVGCGRSTVYKLKNAGEIEFAKIGRRTVVTTDPVAFLEARKIK